MITADQLRATVQHYKEHGDLKGAKNYIKTLGPQVKGFDVYEELFQLENKKKPVKDKPEKNEEVKKDA